VVYTAIIGFIALAWWIYTLLLRIRAIKRLRDEI
jgi:hypothetical protein